MIDLNQPSIYYMHCDNTREPTIDDIRYVSIMGIVHDFNLFLNNFYKEMVKTTPVDNQLLKNV